MYSEDWIDDVDYKEFWQLIELARQDRTAFIEELKTKDRRSLIRFAWTFEDLASELGGEAFEQFTNPSFSEDVLDGLWEEVVGRGREFYEDVVIHPEKMPQDIDPTDSSHRIRSDAMNVFYERYGVDFPPYGYDY